MSALQKKRRPIREIQSSYLDRTYSKISRGYVSGSIGVWKVTLSCGHVVERKDDNSPKGRMVCVTCRDQGSEATS